MDLDLEVGIMKSVVSKIDQSIEKISQVSNDIGRLLAVHNERIIQLERMGDLRKEETKELQERISVQTREIVDKIELVQTRLEHKLNTQAAASHEGHKSIQSDINTAISKVEDRVSSLENWKWWVIGAAASFGFGLGVITSVLKLFM